MNSIQKTMLITTFVTLSINSSVLGNTKIEPQKLIIELKHNQLVNLPIDDLAIFTQSTVIHEMIKETNDASCIDFSHVNKPEFDAMFPILKQSHLVTQHPNNAQKQNETKKLIEMINKLTIDQQIRLVTILDFYDFKELLPFAIQNLAANYQQLTAGVYTNYVQDFINQKGLFKSPLVKSTQILLLNALLLNPKIRIVELLESLSIQEMVILTKDLNYFQTALREKIIDKLFNYLTANAAAFIDNPNFLAPLKKLPRVLIDQLTQKLLQIENPNLPAIYYELGKESSASVITSNSQYVITTDNYGLIIIWDINTGTVVNQFQNNPYITQLLVTNDNAKIIGAAANGDIAVWSFDGTLHHTLKGDVSITPIMQLSNNNQKIISAQNNNIRIWDINTGKLDHIIPIDTPSKISSLAITPDDEKIVAGISALKVGNDVSVAIIDTNTAKIISSIRTNNPQVKKIVITPDRTAIILDGNIKLINLSKGAITDEYNMQPVQRGRRPARTPSINNFCITSDGSKLFISASNLLLEYNIIGHILINETMTINAHECLITNNNNTLLIVDQYGVLILNQETKKQSRLIYKPVGKVLLTNDNKWLITVGKNSRIYELDAAEPVKNINQKKLTLEQAMLIRVMQQNTIHNPNNLDIKAHDHLWHIFRSLSDRK